MHEFHLDIMRSGQSRLAPFYERKLPTLTVLREDSSTQLITAQLEILSPARASTVEKVRDKYAVGGDGARSVVHNQIGQVLDGEFANQAWGVMDVLAVMHVRLLLA